MNGFLTGALKGVAESTPTDVLERLQKAERRKQREQRAAERAAIRAEYNYRYKLYLQAVRRYEKRYGIEIERRKKVKSPTEASLRALYKERERLIAHKWKLVDRTPEPVPEPIPTPDPEDIRAQVELEEVKSLISEAEDYVSPRNDGSTVMISGAADSVRDIFINAESRLSAREIMNRLRGAYGNGLSPILDAIQKMLYAVYNSRNMSISGTAATESGFAKWTGREARGRWTKELDRLREILS